jgi:hypothetical protein
MKPISQSQIHNKFSALQNQLFIKMIPSLQGLPNWKICPLRKENYKNYSKTLLPNCTSAHDQRPAHGPVRTVWHVHSCGLPAVWHGPVRSMTLRPCTVHTHGLYDLYNRTRLLFSFGLSKKSFSCSHCESLTLKHLLCCCCVSSPFTLASFYNIELNP